MVRGLCIASLCLIIQVLQPRRAMQPQIPASNTAMDRAGMRAAYLAYVFHPDRFSISVICRAIVACATLQLAGGSSTEQQEEALDSLLALDTTQLKTEILRAVESPRYQTSGTSILDDETGAFMSRPLEREYTAFISLLHQFDLEESRPVALHSSPDGGLYILSNGGLHVTCRADISLVFNQAVATRDVSCLSPTSHQQHQRVVDGLIRLDSALHRCVLSRIAGNASADYTALSETLMQAFVQGQYHIRQTGETLDLSCARFCQEVILPLVASASASGGGGDAAQVSKLAEHDLHDLLQSFASESPIDDFKAVVDGVLALFAVPDTPPRSGDPVAPSPFVENVCAGAFQAVVTARIELLRSVALSLVLITALYMSPAAPVNLTSLGVSLDAVSRVLLAYHGYAVMYRVLCRERGRDDVPLFNRLISGCFSREVCYPAATGPVDSDPSYAAIEFPMQTAVNVIAATGLAGLADIASRESWSAIDFSTGEFGAPMSPRLVAFLSYLCDNGYAGCMLGVLEDLPVAMRGAGVSYLWAKGLIQSDLLDYSDVEVAVAPDAAAREREEDRHMRLEEARARSGEFFERANPNCAYAALLLLIYSG